MKKYIGMLAVILCLVLTAACGRGYVPRSSMDESASATETVTESEAESETTQVEPEETEAITEATFAQTNTTVRTSAVHSNAAARTQRTVVSTAAKINSIASTNAHITTTTRVSTPPTAASTAAATNPPVPVYTQADYDEIIRIIRDYADAKTNARFVWDTSLTREKADRGLAGYHGMPNLTQHGKQSVIDSLKYHVDLTAENIARNANGMKPIVNYHVYWYVDSQGTWGFGPNDVCFILIYG